MIGSFVLLAFCSCAVAPEPSVQYLTINEMITEASSRTMALLKEGNKQSLAVYYFTTGDQESELSDYIINGLTTELANLAGERVNILSRQGLDRVMSEYSYQLSDMVDRDEQVNIGKQLGADLILTGFIDPLTDSLRLNAQLIEIETARVLGGYVLNFVVPAELALRVPSADETSAVQKDSSRRLAQVQGAAIVTTIYEDFDSMMSEMPFTHHEEHWGERIVDAYGKTQIISEKGRSFVAYDFNAEFDHVNLLDGWQDSDVGFYFQIDTGFIPSEADGISFDMYMENCTRGYLSLRQQKGDTTESFYVPIQKNPEHWQTVNIPFSLFTGHDLGTMLDPDLPFVLEMYVSFEDNYRSFHFREGTEIKGRLAFDNIGVFEKRAEDPLFVLAAFEDEIDRSTVTFETYGTSLYTDYVENDDGIQAENESVENQTLFFQRLEDGPAGSFLDMRSELLVNEKFPGTYELYSIVKIQVAAPDIGDFAGISFLMKSDIAEYGGVDIIDLALDEYYYADFPVGGSWSRIRLDFNELGLSLSGPQVLLLSFSFDLPMSALKRTEADGIVSFGFSIDDILLYE